MRKICVFTGTRAEYGLLKPLLEEIRDDSDLELRIIASCMHLSPEFGLTYQIIEEDGFVIDEKIENLLSSDTPTGICKSMGLGLISYAEALERVKPDLNVILGDRFEAFAFAAASMVSRIPIAHLYGGEATYGLIDEPIRHSITKMSHLHFTSTEEYRRRVIQLGESPDKVFNVGALGIENIRKIKLLTKEELENEIEFKLKDQCILVTFHPVTLEEATAGMQFQNLLDALDVFENLCVIFTKTNSDTYGRVINKTIDNYVARNQVKAAAFTSLGQLKYLSAMQHAEAVVGNTSSGIIEAPSFKIPTVDIGDRQKGRVRADSIIDCPPQKEAIVQALKRALSPEFNRSINDMINPYEKDNTAKNIMKVIKDINLSNILKKEFHDISFADKQAIELGNE